MSKITSIEISYFYDEDDFEAYHAGYFDTFEEAISFLEQESKERRLEKVKNLYDQIHDIEEELFRNGLSDIRKFALLKRRDKLLIEIEKLT